MKLGMIDERFGVDLKDAKEVLDKNQAAQDKAEEIKQKIAMFLKNSKFKGSA